MKDLLKSVQEEEKLKEKNARLIIEELKKKYEYYEEESPDENVMRIEFYVGEEGTLSWNEYTNSWIYQKKPGSEWDVVSNYWIYQLFLADEGE